MNDSGPKKHHYIPQFILKNFCVSKKKQIYVFDKKKLNVFASHVRDVAHENSFYQDDGLGYEIDTESKLATLESKCAPIIERIISEESIKNVDKFEHTLLCLFTTVQLSRTKNTRERLSSINKIMADWFRRSGIDPNKDVENFREQTEIEVNESAINILRSAPGKLAGHLLDKECRLLKCPKGEHFYISDHPITMHNHDPRPGRGNHGLGLKGIEIHFPLSSKLCLTFICADTVSEIRRRVHDHNMRISQGTAFPIDMSEPEEFINGIDRKVTKVLVPENVEFQNSLQVSQSSRFVYSKDKEFELAKDMLRTNPELSEPNELCSDEYAF